MVSAFLNSVKIPELRRRILYTLAVIVVVRLGAAITTPGVNPAVLQDWFRTSSQSAGGGVAALFNLFSGGALENCAVFSLGIMPYISASIMLQLLTAVISSLSRLSEIISDEPGFTAEILAGDNPTGGFVPFSEEQEIGRRTTLELAGGKSYRYYVIWITDPNTRARVNEVRAG